MKNKELKNLAKKIAEQEYIIQQSQDQDSIDQAQNEIMRLSGMVHSFEDLDLIDAMVQKILEKKLAE